MDQMSLLRWYIVDSMGTGQTTTSVFIHILINPIAKAEASWDPSENTWAVVDEELVDGTFLEGNESGR